MIVRIWTGETPLEKADEYLRLMKEVGLPDYRSTPWNLGAFVLRRDRGDRAEFKMVTFWPSLEAIKGFAGEPVERAKYYDFDPDFLLRMDPEVEHYEAFGSGPLDVSLESGPGMPFIDRI